MRARKPLSDKIPTAEEVANFLRIHLSTVYRLAQRGDLPPFRVGFGVIGASVALHLRNAGIPQENGLKLAPYPAVFNVHRGRRSISPHSHLMASALPLKLFEHLVDGEGRCLLAGRILAESF